MVKKFLKQIEISPIAIILFPILWIMYAAVVILKFVLLGISVDQFNHTLDSEVWMRRIFLIAVCFLLEYLFNVVEPVIDSWYTERKMKCLRITMGEKINRLPYQKIEELEKGDILSRSSVDVERVRIFLEDDIPTFGIISFLGMSGFIICFLINIKFLAAFILSIPIVMALGMLSGYLLRNDISEWKEYSGKVNGMGLELLKKLTTIKIFALENVKKKEFQDKVILESDKEKEIALRKARYSFIRALCLTFPTLVLMLVGAWLVWNEEISAGSFTIMLAMSSKVANLTGSVQWFFYEVEEFKGSAKRIFELLHLEEDLTEQTEILTEQADDAVVFRNVFFQYSQGENNATVLKNINLNIKSGQKVAIVGASGCGKSTLLNLISGLYTESEGKIIIEGIEKNKDNIWAVREKSSCIMQKDYLFHTTIRDNICCGENGITQEEMELAAKKAYIDEFVSSLQKGYETFIDEDGKSMSQGQKQRICLSRALLHKRPILLLDEPTAALDWKSESLVKKTIHELEPDITVIAVSHNKEFIKDFDYVYCMKDGEIVEEGTMEEVVQKDGEFCSLFQLAGV